jgi:signal transduction histidine kinase
MVTLRATGTDVAVVAVAAGLGVWEALARPDDPGPPRWTAPLAVVIALCLLGRRRRPGAVVIAVAVLGVTPHVAADVPAAFYGFLLPFVVAAYSAAARLDLRRSLVVPITAAGVIVALAARGHEYRSVNDVAIVVLGSGVAYAAGRVTAGARAHARQAVAAADLLTREQDLRAREAVAAERARVARELHDAVAHDVSVMVIQATAADRMFDRDPAAARAALRAVQTAGRRTIDDLSLMLGALRADEPAELGPAPGMDDLPGLVERVRAAGLPVELVLEGVPAEVPGAVALSVFRVVQESLTNVLKHAEGARATVWIGHDRERLTVRIDDDGGSGQPPGAWGGGQGLIGMRERVDIFGGSLEAGPRPDGGYRVQAELPLSVTAS